MRVSNDFTLTGDFYRANRNDYSPLGEKPSYYASNTVPAISGAVASSKESSELGNADFGAIDWRAANRRAGRLGVDGAAHGCFSSARRRSRRVAALATLVAMKVVLGLDNLVFIALLSNRIDDQRRGPARGLGLSLALLFRLALLASASWAASLSCRGRGHDASGPLLPDSHKLKSCYR